MLKDFGGEVDHRLLIPHILKVLPASFVTAKAQISMLTECSLEKAKTILQAHLDQQKLDAKSSSSSRMALQTVTRSGPSASYKGQASGKPAKKRPGKNFPKTPGAVCEKCGYKNHTAEQCRQTKGYSCKTCVAITLSEYAGKTQVYLATELAVFVLQFQRGAFVAQELLIDVRRNGGRGRWTSRRIMA